MPDAQEPESPPKPPRRKPGGPKAGGRRKQKDTQAVVAAMYGMGMTHRKIGKLTGRSHQAITQLVNGPIARESELQAIVMDARTRLAPQAVDIAEMLLHKIRDSTEGIDTIVGRNPDGSAIIQKLPPPMREQASALREVAAVAGLTRDAPNYERGGGGQKAALTVNFQDAATVASFVQALRMLNEPTGGPVVELERVP